MRCGRVACLQRVGHCAQRAGRSIGNVPLRALEAIDHRLEFEVRSRARAFHALFGDLAVGEEARAQADATHVQALESLGRQPVADDELRAAAADVDHESLAALVRRRVRHPEVNQSRLFDAGDDFDRVAERVARALQESPAAVRLAQGVGADDAHAFGAHVAQALAEPFEALQCTLGRVATEAALFVEARSESNHLAQAIEHDQLPVVVTGDDHVKAVGAEVNRREDVRHPVRHGGESTRQVENDEPHPQVVWAFGLRITNCAPSRSSR